MSELSNERLAELTGLPNLDTIMDPTRLIALANIADRKSQLRTYTAGRALAFTLYADRAYDLSEA